MIFGKHAILSEALTASFPDNLSIEAIEKVYIIREATLNKALYGSYYDFFYGIQTLDACKKNSGIHADTLFLGHSYSRNAIDLNILSSCLNFSFTSQDFKHSCRYLKHIASEGKITKAVLCIGSFDFGFKLESSGDKHRIEDFYSPIDRYLETKIPVEIKLDKTPGLEKLSEFICQQHLIHYTKDKNFFNPYVSRKRFSKIGSEEWAEIEKEKRKQLGISRAKSHRKIFDNPAYYQENTQHVLEMASTCQKKNVDFHIIRLPVSESYMEGFGKCEMESIHELCMGIAKDNNLSFHDLSNMKNIGDFDFTDMDHLNEKGSKKVSQKIKEIIRTKNHKECKHPSFSGIAD